MGDDKARAELDKLLHESVFDPNDELRRWKLNHRAAEPIAPRASRTDATRSTADPGHDASPSKAKLDGDEGTGVADHPASAADGATPRAQKDV
eukprot:3670788-Pleurochrysis_carterae.AAC.1